MGLGTERPRGRMVVLGFTVFPKDFARTGDLGSMRQNQFLVSAVLDWLLEGARLYAPMNRD